METMDGGTVALVVDSTNAYVAGGTVAETPLDGGASTTLGTTPGYAVVAAGGTVYWAGGAEILSAPVGGGAVTTLATGQNSPSGITFDGTSVYWTNVGGGGSVMKVGIDGGAPVTLASSPVATTSPVAGSILVDETSVYWAGSGAIMKVTPK
jgi:hypothetical protein